MTSSPPTSPGSSGASRADLEAYAAALQEQTRRQAGLLPRDVRADPVRYAEHVFGLRIWSRQAEFLRAVAANPRVTVTSGHKTGKSISFAILAWWFAGDPEHRPEARVALTSSSFRQVIRVLWREIRSLWRKARARGFELPEPALDPETGVRWDDGREIFGFSTKDPEKAAGTSGAHLLYLVDEASGVPNTVFEALEGNRAGGAEDTAATPGGGAKLVLASNPTQQSGEFFDSHHTQRALYVPLTISSEEAAAVEPPIPGLATRAWIEDKRVKWGADSPVYAVRVLGRFPTTASDAVISLSLVLDGIARHADTRPSGPLVIGLDVARFGGDETVAAPRRGKYVYPLLRIAPGDGPDTATRLLVALDDAGIVEADEKPTVNVDAIGLGVSVFDALARSPKVKAIAVNTGSRASDPDEFNNLRSELHFAGRDFLKEGGALPDDTHLQGEAVAPKYKTDARGRIAVESKDEVRKRLPGGRSPDACDAWLLSLYAAPPSHAPSYADARGGYRRGAVASRHDDDD